nr:carbohydrate binding domain-containing protein [Paenibacillus sp. BK720]
MRGISVPAAGVPDAPLITGHQASGGKVQLKWRGAAAADKYTVERATAGASGPWTVVCNQCATDTSTPWTDSTSVSGTAYWYRVKAHNLAGVAGSYSPVYATGGTALPAPGAFTQSSPASGATGQSVLPTFSWNASSNAASYTLVVADNSSYTSPVINAGGLTSTSYAAGSALAYNKTYYWKVTAVNGTGSTAASNAGLTFTTAAQSTSAAVDSFDSYSSDSALQSAYVRNTDGGALTVTRDAANKNDGTYGMKFAYTIAASPANFAGATKQLGTADWSGATGLSLWLKPDGSNRTLTIQFKETSGELWETYYTLSGTTAGIVNLPFSSFNHPGWYSGGNGVKDLNTVKEYSIYVNQGSGTTGSSTIYLDAITAGQVGGGTQPPSDAIDSFDSYASNSALQAAYNMNSSGSAITPTLDTSLKSDGTSSMKLSYSITTGANYSGVIHPISASWSGKTGLSLWVKPDGSNRTLTVQFKEAGGEPWETTYALSGTTATTIQVPFSSFARPSWYSGGNSTRDLGSIAEINFYINQGSGSTGSSAINIDAVKTY